MDDRRLVGIDLGIISAHTVRVLAGDGSLVCRCKAIPTVDSLERVERAAGRLLHLLLNDQFGARVWAAHRGRIRVRRWMLPRCGSARAGLTWISPIWGDASTAPPVQAHRQCWLTDE